MAKTIAFCAFNLLLISSYSLSVIPLCRYAIVNVLSGLFLISLQLWTIETTVLYKNLLV